MLSSTRALSMLMLVLSLCLTAVPRAAAQDDVATILESGDLAKAYNPVLLNFLLGEGKGVLPEEQRKQAIDQLVTALKATIEISQGEAIAANLTDLSSFDPTLSLPAGAPDAILDAILANGLNLSQILDALLWKGQTSLLNLR